MTRSSTRSRLAALTTALTGLSLVVAGCGVAGGHEDTRPQDSEHSAQESASVGESVYQFDEARVVDEGDQVPFVATDAEGPILVRLSEDLAAVVADGLNVAIDHFTVTPKAFTTGVCRTDVDVTYADGGRDALSMPTPNIDGEPMQNVAASITSGIDENEVEIVDAPPSDDAIENGGSYITADGSTLTLVEDCSEDPQNTDFAVELLFPYTTLGQGMGYREVIATAYVAVVPGGGQNGGTGTTAIITGEVRADVSPNGTWQSK